MLMIDLRKFFLLLVCMVSLVSRAGDTIKYCTPFDFPLLLSANFGELRPNHFHNGLDFKTKGTVGHPVRCIADGYVSRVAVQHGGYGQAIYITHPDGHTSVYGHVLSFAPEVEKYVRDYQYANETFVCYLYPEPGRFKFKKGDIIALSGNEGASAGPHLHLEIRKTGTDEYLDPMPYFKKYIKDTKAPQASLIGLYPVKGKGVIDGSANKKIYTLASLKSPVQAWGQIYAAISAKDYMDGTTNFYGVHSVTLYVDSVMVFRSVTDSVLPDENRMINTFTDYDELVRTRRLLMRSYKSPGNLLRLHHTGPGNGVITIDSERDYKFVYVLEDNFGNKSTYRFTVRGKKQHIPEYHMKGEELLPYNCTAILQRPGMEFIIPKGMLYDDTEVTVRISDLDTMSVSLEYDIDAGNTPLHGYCPLAIGVRKLNTVSPDKYYVRQIDGKRSYYVGGEYDNGWMRAKVRNFGKYSVAVDTIPPSVVPVDKAKWRSTSNIRFKVSDRHTGIGTYKVYIDGKFVLFGLKKGILVIQDKEKVRRGVPHKLEVVVTDNCGNETRKQLSF